jgi:hypothetical protein
MAEFIVTFRTGKEDTTVTAARYTEKWIGPRRWLILFEDGGTEVARFRSDDVVGVQKMSSRPSGGVSADG